MSGEITSLLNLWSSGDRQALQDLMPLVYPRLRAIANGVSYNNKPDSTVQPTVIVHETYLRLLRQQSLTFNDREHFYAFAAQCMRFILVDHFRSTTSEKRGGQSAHIPLHDELPWISVNMDRVLEVNRALDEFAQIDPRKVRLVELRYFLGCSAEETAEVSNLSLATVKRELRLARAWLFERLGGESVPTEV